MPRLDETGPNGMGPMTGGGFGRCTGGTGRGVGYGVRQKGSRRFAASNYNAGVSQPAYISEIDALRQENTALKAKLDDLSAA